MLSVKMLIRISTLAAFVLLSAAVHAADPLPKVLKPGVAVPVTLTDNGTTWTLDNGLVKATINKNNGNMPSLIYHGIAIVGRSEFWETVPAGTVTPAVTIDPAKNNGARAEVAVKGVNGRMDIEVRYTMERGLSGFYTYAEYTHGPTYPAAGFGENRFILQMNPTFDWISVDADRNMLMCSNEDVRNGVVIHAKEQKILLTGIYKNSVEHKYSYNGVMYKLPAWGWSSTKDHIGVYFMNPSIEYIGGGAAKLDLVGPHGSHSARLLDLRPLRRRRRQQHPRERTLEACGRSHLRLLQRARRSERSHPGRSRSTQSHLRQRQVPPYPPSGTTTAPPSGRTRSPNRNPSKPRGRSPGSGRRLSPQRGARNGHRSVRPQRSAGRFKAASASHRRPHAPGLSRQRQPLPTPRGQWHHRHLAARWQLLPVLGRWRRKTANSPSPTSAPAAMSFTLLPTESSANMPKPISTVEAGQDREPRQARLGARALWQTALGNRLSRTAPRGKFFKGDGANYWLWGWPLRYGDLFPNDIAYTIGKSDYHKDWFFEEVPHALSDDWKNPGGQRPPEPTLRLGQ